MVTGGAGFIGSHLVRRLVADGAEVTVIDDLSTGRRENLDGAAVNVAQRDLARDVVTCINLGEKFGEALSIFPAIKQSNDRHRQWALRCTECRCPS